MTHMVRRLAAIAIAALLLAGCDKCGERVNFNTPSIPNTCGANAEQTR